MAMSTYFLNNDETNMIIKSFIIKSHASEYKEVLYRLVLKFIKQRKDFDNIEDNDEPIDQFPSDIFQDFDNHVIPTQEEKVRIDSKLSNGKRYYQENVPIHEKKASKTAANKKTALRSPININFTALWGLIFLEQCLLKEVLEFKDVRKQKKALKLSKYSTSVAKHHIYEFMINVINSHNSMDFTTDTSGYKDDSIYKGFYDFVIPKYEQLFSKRDNILMEHIIETFFQFLIAVAYSAESDVWNNSTSKTYNIKHLSKYIDYTRRTVECNTSYVLFGAMSSYAVDREKKQSRADRTISAERIIATKMKFLVDLDHNNNTALRDRMMKQFDDLRKTSANTPESDKLESDKLESDKPDADDKPDEDGKPDADASDEFDY